MTNIKAKFDVIDMIWDATRHVSPYSYSCSLDYMQAVEDYVFNYNIMTSNRYNEDDLQAAMDSVGADVAGWWLDEYGESR